MTTAAVRKLQRRAGLTVDGVVGPATRKALGRYGRGMLGRRELADGAVGWDVAELQFSLAWHGFASGRLDGRFGPRTDAALRRFQAWAGVSVDGVVGPATLVALRQPAPTSPVALAHPVLGEITDRFGPRGNRFHTGVDYPAPAGTPVAAPAAGTVTFAGWLEGGWGYVVTIAVGSGVRTMLAHLARVDVVLGQRVSPGPAGRHRRLDRELHRAAPPLRGSAPRRRRRPDARARLTRHQVAITRAGPPDPSSHGITPTNAVAPFAGILDRFARFSIPNRLAPSSVRCAANTEALPGSRLSVSTPIPAISRSSISHSTASPLKPGKCDVPAASALR